MTEPARPDVGTPPNDCRQTQSQDHRGRWGVSFPIHSTGLLGWKVRRACRKAGGHWMHGMIGRWSFACCQCGYETDDPQIGVLCVHAVGANDA